MKSGSLYLIPVPLGEIPVRSVIPSFNLEIIQSISEFIVEDARSARRHLKQMGITQSLDTLIFHDLGKHSDPGSYGSYLNAAQEGRNIGLLSEAGCPGIADPGAQLVTTALKKGIRVIPLSGPSSIIMALMASGSNGQNFAFHGYLPIERKDRANKLKELEHALRSRNQTQLFIEVPFRNDKLLDDIIRESRPDTELCIACDISLPTEYIERKTVSAWKQTRPILNKRPAVFVFCC